MDDNSLPFGSRVLVDIADYDRDQQLRLKENFVGVFLGIGDKDGRPVLRFERISDNHVIQIAGVPIDLWPAARDLKYTVRQTGEVVDHIDFIVQWVYCDEVPGSTSIGRISIDPE